MLAGIMPGRQTSARLGWGRSKQRYGLKLRLHLVGWRPQARRIGKMPKPPSGEHPTSVTSHRAKLPSIELSHLLSARALNAPTWR